MHASFLLLSDTDFDSLREGPFRRAIAFLRALFFTSYETKIIYYYLFFEHEKAVISVNFIQILFTNFPCRAD